MANPKLRFKFTKKSIEDMKELTVLTKNTGIEHGGILCIDSSLKKIVDVQNKCLGSSCTIKIGNIKCKNDTFYRGDFHTHPTKNPVIFSIADILSHIESSPMVSCVGSTSEKDNIRCKIDDIKSMDEYWKEKVNLQEAYDIQREILKGKDVPLDKQLKVKNCPKYFQDKFLYVFNPEDNVEK